MPDVSPDPKPSKRPEARTRPRRTFRKRATRSEWTMLRAQKLAGQPCAVCRSSVVKDLIGPFELHHLVPRSRGGDDVADNLVCVHPDCHMLIHARNPLSLAWLARHLTDAEYAYCVSKLGEGAMGRLFGV